MTRLLINIDHVATLRNARQERFPDPVHAAVLCELAGADGIVFHLREDRRHIRERDVRLLKETVQGRIDFELSTNEEIVAICLETQPHLATLVPERRQEITTEGGLDVVQARERLETLIPRFHERGIEVSLFVDPIPTHIELAAELGADAIELHTGQYANAPSEAEALQHLEALARAAEIAHGLGLHVHAGHGLNYHNYPPFREHVPHLREVSIGFAIIARAVLVGMEQAVREMRLLVKGY